MKDGQEVQQKKDATKKRGTLGNANSKGNPGNRYAAPPERNSSALKHDFYARHLPEEFLEIMNEVRQADPINLIWDQIVIQYTAIIRAQKVMWVASSDDHLKEESGSNWGYTGGSESHKVSFAYQQYYAYLSAQTRAIAELRNLIKQFDYLSGAARMPKTVIKGQEAGTIAGAQYDVMNYYSALQLHRKMK